MSTTLQEVLDYIDMAIDLLREYIEKVGMQAEEDLEDVIYHLEEAGDILNNYISKAGEE